MNPNDINQRLEILEARAANSEAQSKTDREALVLVQTRLHGTRSQMRATWGVAVLGVICAFTVGYHKEAVAQSFDVTVDELAMRMTAMETKTASMSTLNDGNGNATVRFSNVNVQIVSGSGATDGAVNGLGNLVIGYNESFGDSGDERGGSHNIVVGNFHDYTAYGGFVADCII